MESDYRKKQWILGILIASLAITIFLHFTVDPTPKKSSLLNLSLIL